MNVVVLINGREAIPVRAIPYMAETTVSADILVRGLLGADHVNSLHGLSAYQCVDGGKVISIPAVEWRRFATQLQALSDGLNRQEKNGELTHAEGSDQWKRESVKLLPSGVFLWKDEFRREHFRSFRRLSDEELAQNYRHGIEMNRELVSAPDDSYTAELMAAHGAPENWREVLQAGIDEAAAEGPFIPEAFCIYERNRCEPKDTDALSDVTFYPVIEQDERLIVMQGFEHIDESTTQTVGEIAQILAKSFGSPIDDLPPTLREIAEAYIPNWSELSGADRRARADEVDRQRQDALAEKFEKFRRDVEQANAAIPDRFKEREFQDGFNKVEREKNGERDFEAKRGAVNLSDARCIELARKAELEIADWIELTGVGIGECHCLFLVATDGVRFIKWKKGFIKAAPAEWQIDMLRDNQHKPLEFPCTPARMIDFIDSELCTIFGCFSVPDAFRRAVTESAPTPDTSRQVPAKPLEIASSDNAKQVDPWIIAAREIANEIWLRMLNLHQTPTKEGVAPEIAERLWIEKFVTKRRRRVKAGYIVRFALGKGWTPPTPD